MTTKEAYLALNLLSGIGPVRVKQLLQVYSSPQDILAASETALAAIPGLGAKRASLLANWREHIELEKELELAAETGATIITREDPEYPEPLRQIKDAPLVLYAKGELKTLTMAGKQGLAIVGSRRTTIYGEKVTARLAGSAAQAGWVIVSGLARGIDTAAHRATLECGGRTIAVTAGGLTAIYPQENEKLAAEIAEKHGCVLSEQPLAIRPDKRTFPMRNRIIAGMCLGTLVTEAGLGSGALITAAKALEYGRKVFAVPGRIDSPQSRGCNELIKHGAKLVESLDDILNDFNFLPGLQLPSSPAGTLEAARSPAAASNLSELEKRVCELLEAGELGMDELVRHSGEPVSKLLAILMGMELKRLITQLPGKRFTLYQ